MIKEVFPKRIDRRAVQFEFQRLVDAFLDLAEDELSAGKPAAGAPTHSGDAGKTFDTPLTMPLTFSSKTR